MAVKQHDEHSFDLDLLLSGRRTAIDVGCRGFSLPRFLASQGVEVWAYDVDPRVSDPGIPSVRYSNSAVLGWWDYEAAVRGGPMGPVVGVNITSDPAATSVILGDVRSARIPAIPILEAAASVGELGVGLLKLDCEGSEYAILDEIAGLSFSVAQQISVEYHDHCGVLHPRGEKWFSEIAERLARLYTIVKHEKETPPWGGVPSYVDCLYIAK